ncbi:MAG: MFS transporter [Candidatus Omnitrophica bacterium]|nr:MFS transporter [Candidatus Omnitrophota bacterium]
MNNLPPRYLIAGGIHYFGYLGFMSKFSEVLKNRNFFCLWLGQIISQLGDRLGQMALIGFVSSARPGSSTVEIAKMLFFTIAPVFVIGPLAGVYVDRWDRRRTMYLSDFLRTIIFFVIPFFLYYSKSLWLVYLLIFLAFCVGRFFIPAKLSIVPELVKSKDLLIANSLINITGMIAAIGGFGLGGLVVEWWGAKNGLYLDGLTFFISGLLIFLISHKSKSSKINLWEFSYQVAEVIRKSVLEELREGIVYFWKNKEVRFAAWVMFVLSAALGGSSVVLIGFIQKVFNSVTRDFGLLSMFLGLGLFFGSISYGRFGQRISRYKIIFISLVLSGSILILFVLSQMLKASFLIAACFAFIMGVAISPIVIVVNTAIHNFSHSAMMGKVFSSLEMVMHFGFIAFMFISGLLTRIFSYVIILNSLGIILILTGIVNLIFHRKIPWLD